MHIVCLPIDSRPCSTQFIRRITSWAGSELTLPSPGAMDHFTRPASFGDSLRFLEQELPRADAAVISLDHFCYGSLLASREETMSEQEALSRVGRLRSLLQLHPEVPVYLSSVILRSSLSVLRRTDLAAFQAMTDYSVYSDRVSRFHLPEDEARLKSAIGRIPPAVLERTLQVRRRNLQVNLAAVDLAGSGCLAGLILLQEDCQEYGLPKQDQQAIEARIREKACGTVHIRNGTDEAGAMLAARALWAGRPPLEAEIRFSGKADFIAPFEDRPFCENLRIACEEIGIRPVSAAGTVICVCCPENGEQLDAMDPVSPGWLKACAATADRAVREGKRVYLLDVLRANGGVPDLIRGMREADRLWGYSAWNTASNAMGTLLAQMLSDALAGAPNSVFLQERLLDDLAYQARIRSLLNEDLAALGEDELCLKDKPRAEARLRALYRQELPGLWPLRNLPEYRVSLPWPRTFEVMAEIIDESDRNGEAASR